MTTFCPNCGHFSSTNESICSNPECSVIEKTLLGYGRGAENLIFSFKMYTATTENRFCGHCNKIFRPDKMICPFCNRETSQLTESHLEKNVVLLSGTATARFWEP